MINKYTGEATLKIKGKDHIVFYGWDQIAKLKSVFSQEQINDVIDGNDCALLAEMLAVGLQKHHPDVTAAKIKENAPPIYEAITAVGLAIRFAYFGPDDPAIINAADAAEKAEKKTKRSAKPKSKTK